MILSQLEERIPMLYLASCEEGGASPYVTSAPGRGKTSVLKRFIRRMKQIDPNGKYGMVVLNGATLNIATMGGYLQFGPMIGNRPTSLFSIPWWWWANSGNRNEVRKLLEEFDGGIILIDEADKMPSDEAKTTGEAAYAGVWMTHELPPGWVVWFAGNRVQDQSGSNKLFRHLINRQREIPIRDDTHSWVTWAEQAHLLPELITFGKDSQWLFQDMPKDAEPWCTPRSLHQAEIHLRAIMRVMNTKVIPTDPIVQEELGGGIGAGAARDLMLHIREAQELPSYDDVIAAPRGTMIPSKPDGKRLMAYRISHNLKLPDIKSALDYMGRYGDEFQAIFARMAIQHNHEVVLDDNFGKWCDDKAALIAMLEQYKNVKAA